MSLQVGWDSYLIEPYHILSYDCRKDNGSLPVVQIGKKCSIARNCTFALANHLVDRVTTSPSPHGNSLFNHKQGNPSGYSKGDIIIKHDVWVGTNCTILDGITIGTGAVIAAGSVVVKSVPAYAIVGGNPAKVIRYRFSPEINEKLEKFWELPVETIQKYDIHTSDIESFIHTF
uniref:Acetyltransferase n=1 Tax=viral metagenome TaxID=1070528 RepID=A0A6C0B1C4_9ZZZZ